MARLNNGILESNHSGVELRFGEDMPKKKGEKYECGECGMIVVVEDECGCEECDIICCETPMKKVPAKKKPVAKKVARKKKK